MKSFSSAFYRIHNEARLQHLASLYLPLHGRVLEVGAGPGDHTSFYLARNCTVVATDAREECVQTLKKRHPQVEAFQIDMNHPEPLFQLGRFDIVHCYGLLYHLENPKAAIEAMSKVCDHLLVLETCVSAGTGCSLNPVNEVLEDYSQSTTGHGCRPTRDWVFSTLEENFPFVYQTRTQPIHPEFPTDWTKVPPDHGLIRIVLLATRRELNLPTLSPVLLDRQEQLPYATPAEIEVRDAALEELRRELAEANQRATQLEGVAGERLALLLQATRELELFRKKSLVGRFNRFLESLRRAG